MSRASASGHGASAVAEDWRTGRWTPELAPRAWATLAEHPSPVMLMLALEVQHALAGLEPLHLERAQTLLESAAVGDEASAVVPALRLVSAHLAGGEHALARAALQTLLDGGPRGRRPFGTLRRHAALVAALRRQPRVLALLATEHPERLPAPCRRAAVDARALLALERTPDALLGAEASRVAVVGNGPSLLGAGHGPTIDAATRIVRFNRAADDGALGGDVGTRTDLLVLSPGAISRRRLARLPRPGPGVLLSGADPLSRPSRYWRALARHRPRAVGAFPIALWHELVAELHAPPSAGLLMLAWLGRRGKRIDVDARGFDLLEREPARDAPNHYADAEPRSARHDWRAERALLARWRERGGSAPAAQAASPKSS